MYNIYIYIYICIYLYILYILYIYELGTPEQFGTKNYT